MPHSAVLLTTPRLILRRFRDSDAETFARYRSDPAIARYQSWDTPFPICPVRQAQTSAIAEERAFDGAVRERFGQPQSSPDDRDCFRRGAR